MCYTKKMKTFKTYLDEMILSASGWRGIFASSNNEEDDIPTILDEHKAIVTFAAKAFSNYMIHKVGGTCTIVVGSDSRPTGKSIADTMLRAMISSNITIKYIGIVAAPEIMSYAKNFDGFVYISASHNPIGHNGIKFGFSDGGVMPGSEAKKLIDEFKLLCSSSTPLEDAEKIFLTCSESVLRDVYNNEKSNKQESYNAYSSFSKHVISGEESVIKQEKFFTRIKNSIKNRKLTVVCDMNGSARTRSIDRDFFQSLGIGFEDFNNITGKIVHSIIPEGKNLEHCAKKMEELQAQGRTDVLLGYMPDCDGDRGNIVYWNNETNKAEILQAQEVFALSVLSELCYSIYKSESLSNLNLGVAINGPTSMRIDDIANALNTTVFRAEVGEANVVNCARENREKGYVIPIMGEGSNGGNITHPAAVRDPLNTLYALIKLLVICSDSSKQGLFELWCTRTNQMSKYKDNFSLVDIMASLPNYTTTGVSEKRALLKINTRDHAVLKRKFQKIFTSSWNERKEDLQKRYSFYSWEAVQTVGTTETINIDDFSLSGTGGLKICFFNANKEVIASMWMRGSGTEPVFRIMVDIKNSNIQAEKELIAWETELLEKADNV